jgi:hypothetical protein
MYGLTDVWRHWLNGECVGAVYGVKAAWWARGGKSLEFIAALSIVADVVGYKRLRTFGKSLHRELPYRDVRKRVVDTFRWLLLSAQAIFYKFGNRPERAKELLDAAQKYPVQNGVNLTIAVLAAVMTWWYERGKSAPAPMGPLAALLRSLFVGGMIALTIAPLITGVLLLGLNALGVVCDVLIIKPVAWLLDRDSVERRVKIVAAILLLVGFSLDLLFTP